MKKRAGNQVLVTLQFALWQGLPISKGMFCTDDCSGHIAGYQWAEERGISKDTGCTGNSRSFIRGCMQYVTERVEEIVAEREAELNAELESRATAYDTE